LLCSFYEERRGWGGHWHLWLLATPLIIISKRLVPRNLAPDFFVYGGAFENCPCFPPGFVWEVKETDSNPSGWIGVVAKASLSFLI